MLTDEIEDVLVDNLNNLKVSLLGKTYTLKSQRGKETMKFKGKGITVFFESDLEPRMRFVGNIVGKYPNEQVTYFGDKTFTIEGRTKRGFPIVTRVYISAHAIEKDIYGTDGDRLASKAIKDIAYKIKREWPLLLKPYRAQLEGPLQGIRNLPFKVSGEWIYRYIIRFNILSTFMWTEEPIDPTDGVILEVGGDIVDADTDNKVREFSTDR